MMDRMKKRSSASHHPVTIPLLSLINDVRFFFSSFPSLRLAGLALFPPSILPLLRMSIHS